MFIAAVILLSISLIFFGVWVHAMFAMVKQKKPEFQKVDRETKTSQSSISLTGFSKEVSFVKEKGYEAEMKAGMTYSEVAEGIKRKDPNVFIFLRIMIGFGVGIPHASTDLIPEVIGALGRSQTGVNFEAADNQPVKLVMLFLVPQGQFQKHLHTLANIAKLLHRSELRTALNNALDAESMLAIIKESTGRK